MVDELKQYFKNKKIIVGSIILVLFVVSFFYYNNESSNKAIHKGVSIGKIDVSNLMKEDALQKVSLNKINELKTKKMQFSIDDTTISIPYEELGYNIDIQNAVDEAYKIGRSGNIFYDYFNVVTPFIKKEVNIKENFEVNNLNKSVDYLTMKVFKEPSNADVITTKEQGFKVIPSKTGRYLNSESTRESILANISKNEIIPLQVNISYPKITEDKFDGIDALLSEFTTNYSTSAKGRKENIALGSSFFDGLVVDPQQNISFSTTVGEISAKNGFKKAGVLVNGELEQGVGGGICQVSTTLYNALILADIQIDERHNHTRPISYVDIGTDAAVVEGFKDLKFTNNLAHKIYIKTEANGDNLKFQVFGHGADKDYDVKIVTKLLGVEKPSTITRYTSKMFEDEQTVEESGAKGYSYATYKEIIKGDTKTTEKISNSYYLPKDRVILVGTKEYNDDKEVVASSKDKDKRS